ncbi:hypothetical protein [Virgibacillus sp. L01]|uniref:hypothetical protein n=1 Tax=Virgibacillus sp. L01 TaxID=3457429 RepID=UPI003FD39A4C
MYVIYAIILGIVFGALFIGDMLFALSFTFIVIVGCLLKIINVLNEIKSNQSKED